MKRIMIVEDEWKLAKHLEKQLLKYGYDTFVSTNFDNVLEDYHRYHPHLILLDINLPSYDGFYWCRQIRLISTCPVIFISARTSEIDQVFAIENGGDDFITKPFHPDIVLAKVRSQLRRAYGEYASSKQERVIEVEGLQFLPERFLLSFNQKTVSVTKNEAAIIELLLERYPKVIGREDLLEKLWDTKEFVDENTLNVNITRVRKKLEEIGINEAIKTVRGVGYRLLANW